MNDGKQMIEGAADPFVAWHVGDKDRCHLLMRILQGKGEAISHKPLLSLNLDRLYGQTTRAARTIFVARKAKGGTLGLLIAAPHASSGYL